MNDFKLVGLRAALDTWCHGIIPDKYEVVMKPINNWISVIIMVKSSETNYFLLHKNKFQKLPCTKDILIFF